MKNKILDLYQKLGQFMSGKEVQAIDGVNYTQKYSLRPKLFAALLSIILIMSFACLVSIQASYHNLKLLQEARALTQEIANNHINDIESLSEKNNIYRSIERANNIYVEVKSHIASTKTLIVSLIITALILLFILDFYLLNTLINPLKRIIDAIKNITSGELDSYITVNKNHQKEILMAVAEMNKFIDQLSDSIVKVQDSVDKISDGSHDLNESAESLSVSAQEQASSLEETSASTEEMTSTVKQSANNAVEADQLAVESREAAQDGLAMAASIRRSMGLISESSNKIADIIGVIDDIAFQTNLLSLNAAVVAARAGEHGRGFAVVAAEVRNLAQRSATAAREIKDLVEDSMEKVGDGSNLVGIYNTKLEAITHKAKQVADYIAEISASSQEQAIGIDQVNRAIAQMDINTQANATQIEHIASVSQSIIDQGDKIRSIFSNFKLSKKAKANQDAEKAKNIGDQLNRMNKSNNKNNYQKASNYANKTKQNESADYIKSYKSSSKAPSVSNYDNGDMDDWTEF